jgi:hypothetical protein
MNIYPIYSVDDLITISKYYTNYTKYEDDVNRYLLLL